jgi:acyl carrier protein
VGRDQLRELMRAVLEGQGKALPDGEGALLSEIGFRSLDFSELALRVEDEIGDELNFEAAEMRQILTVADVLDFLEKSTVS